MTGEVPSGAITVGIDDSDASLEALRWAVREAELEQRPLCIVHAYDPRPVVYSGLGATFPGLTCRTPSTRRPRRCCTGPGTWSASRLPSSR